MSTEPFPQFWSRLAELQTDVLAIAASLRDMERGETGRPFEEFSREFCERNGMVRDAPCDFRDQARRAGRE